MAAICRIPEMYAAVHTLKTLRHRKQDQGLLAERLAGALMRAVEPDMRWQGERTKRLSLFIKNEAELAEIKEQDKDAKTLCGFCIAVVYNRCNFGLQRMNSVD
jgi:hypothetical protein